MSLVIQLPSNHDAHLKETAALGAKQALVWAAEEFGFDLEEALRKCDLNETKVVRKRGPVPKKGPRAASKPKDPNAKPKAKTGHNLFINAKLPLVKAEMAAKGDQKIKGTDMIVAANKLWSALTDAEKQPWKDQAADLKKAQEEPELVVAFCKLTLDETETEPETESEDEIDLE